jgi:hypothetical protein
VNLYFLLFIDFFCLVLLFSSGGLPLSSAGLLFFSGSVFRFLLVSSLESSFLLSACHRSYDMFSGSVLQSIESSLTELRQWQQGIPNS